ncbi:MAG TPA: sigma-54-dependent Fis family transcriptional regulator, partial [Labilithrix sp.]|nr:sigma-54-dependent Fis family transcriptional regulator [Labilithrix sp.]
AWPGNVRELESMITRLAATAPGTEVTIELLRSTYPAAFGQRELALELTTLTYREMLAVSRERLSKEYFTVLLQEANGNVTHAAARAGLERESLHRLLKRFGLNADSFRPR